MLQTYIDLLLLRGRPQDLPASRTLVGLTAALAALIDAVVETSNTGAASGALLALVQVVVYGVAVYTALVMAGKPERWMQTLAALYGINAFVSLLAWPAYGALYAQGPELQFGWELAVMLLLSLWTLMVTAQVFRHALETTLGRALAVTMLCMMVVWIVMLSVVSTVAPPPVAPGPAGGEGG